MTATGTLGGTLTANLVARKLKKEIRAGTAKVSDIAEPSSAATPSPFF